MKLTDLGWVEYIVVLVSIAFSVIYTAVVAAGFLFNWLPTSSPVMRVANATASIIAVFTVILGYWILVKTLENKEKDDL